MRQKETIIKPRETLSLNYLKEIWFYREILYIFVWRNIKVRYKQTFLGIAWAIIQPLLSMIIFTIFFGNLAKIPSSNLPYPVFVLCGLVFWNFFSNALSQASNSLIENQHIIQKVYVPKIILPLSSIITAGIDFLINLVLLGIILTVFKQIPSWNIFLVIPLAWIISTISAIGIGFFLSALNVKYRDVRYALPFFIQTMIFVTPVIYGTNIIKNSNKIIMALNPMTGVIESVRVSISGFNNFDWQIISISVISSVVIFFLGLLYFNKTEKFFADII